ncbi:MULTISPECIES: flagellar hook-length control protein FliK [Enterobacter]|uniref:flagellar hook-length control protein FliK n=1 Tax=Enterobacter TaxID=547 RepID=UPI001580EDBC|nr:flagellar hook-length control protein FliK [Enterobacter oligotrophicus]MBT9427256.1 flagellar hook-length control protein FliK [Enterobacter oligotrophicus]
MNLMLSHMTQLPVAADATETASILPGITASGATLTQTPASETDSQAAPGFNDALLNIINTLMGGEQPRDSAMVLAGVKPEEEDDEKTQRPDGMTMAQDVIGSPNMLLDALLMASQMPAKTLSVTQSSAPLTGDALQMQNVSAGQQPAISPLKVMPQPLTLHATSAAALEAVTPPALEPVKPMVTLLPTAGQPATVQTFSTMMDKQTVNLPPVRLDADEAKWAQQLHSALNDRLQLQVRNQVQHATIRLDPPEMGKVDISLQIENGRMQVHITASNGETYRALQQISNELRQSLTEQNFVQVNVQVSSQSGQQQGQRAPQHAVKEGPDTGAVIEAEETLSSAGKDDSVLLTV